MVKVPSLEEIKRRYKVGAGRAGEEYRVGVQGAASWREGALKADETYKAAMQEALAANRRAKGIERTSDETWRKGAMDKGANRIAGGMLAAADKQASALAPYLSVIGSFETKAKTLSARANIENNLIPLAEALQAKKKELKG